MTLSAQGSACLFRHGSPPLRGVAKLTRTLGLRPLFTITNSKGEPTFSVSFSGPVQPERDLEEPRNVIFHCPIDPFDQLKLCFDSPLNADNFFDLLDKIEEEHKGRPALNKPTVVYRQTAGHQRERVCSVPHPPAHGLHVQPRPISAASPSAFIKELNTRRAMEAPAKLSSIPPPPPPRRESSLRQNEIPSPRSSSLPSTSTNLQPPSDNCSSYSLDLSNQSNSATIIPKLPTHGSSNNPPYRNDQRRKSLVAEEDLDVFYPADLTPIRCLERGSQGYVELVSTKFISRIAVKYFDQRVKHWESAASRELCYLLKTVTHPHIVQFRGVLFASPSEHSKILGILMEYMECGSVHRAIYDPNNHYNLIEPLNWTRQAASALTFLHKKRLIHRDVKPANMLLSDEGKRLKISDFGLCAAIDTGMTADVGTVVYMAPEVIGRPDGVNYNEKCDVYSLGISLWEMIHRRRPHDGFGFLALMSAVKEGTRPDFADSCCPENIRSLIERMWASKIPDRPRMEEVFEVVYEQLTSTGFFDNLYE